MNTYRCSEEIRPLSRILMTADASEGVWTYVMELARALRPMGIEILLAVMGPALSRLQHEEAAGMSHVGLCEKPFCLEWMKDPWRDVTQAGDWLLELEEQFEPHVVHLNHYCHGSLPWSVPVMITAHGCVLSGWQAVHGEQSPRSWTRYHAEVAAGLRGANMVVASTRSMLDTLTRLYAPIPRLLQFQNASRFPAFRTIPHGRDAAIFLPREKRDQVLCVSGPEDEAQNVALLAKIAKNLAWPVLLAGRESAPETGDALRSLGPLNEAQRAVQMGNAAIFAAPTRYEPFGFAALEAALAGCALVLGDIPCLRETWGDAALFAAANDSGEFEAALRALVEDAGFRGEMAGRARHAALSFTPERMGGEIFEGYRNLIVPKVVPEVATPASAGLEVFRSHY